MKKVIILLVVCSLFGCGGKKQVEDTTEQQQGPNRQQIADSVSAIYQAEYAAKEQLLTAEIDSLNQMLATKTPALKVYQNRIKQAQDSIKELNKLVGNLSADDTSRDSLNNIISSLNEKNLELVRERDQFADQVSSLESEVNRLKAENDKLKAAEKAPATVVKDLDKFKVAGNAVSRLQSEEGRGFVVYKVDPNKSEVRLFWRDGGNELYDNFVSYGQDIARSGELLVFATNGGMYQPDKSPQGLYIEKGKVLQKADTRREGYGNFYMQPNGIFLITDKGEPHVIRTQDLKGYERRGIRYATQSGPMLLTNGKMNSKFMKDSPNFHIRSGVGVNENQELVFIISETRVRFYELAKAFEKMGCKNALYLDGAISQTYLPEIERTEPGGGFGVMIGVSKKN
ncbi:MAG: hypothetical protein HEP71_18125 [Roseivirga sp.]|nr:hypothetical protein [Roseivirga sp.]